MPNLAELFLKVHLHTMMHHGVQNAVLQNQELAVEV